MLRFIPIVIFKSKPVLKIEKSIKISPYILRILKTPDNHRIYAIWLWMKNRFKNGCYYNYNESSVARELGVSRNMIRKYADIFLEKSWCRIHHNNLIFIKHAQHPLKRPNKKCLQLIKIRTFGHHYTNYISAFQAFLIEDAQRKQLYARQTVKPPVHHEKEFRQTFIENGGWGPFTVKRTAELFDVSIATASRILRRLANEGWFERYVPQPHLLSTDVYEFQAKFESPNQNSPDWKKRRAITEKNGVMRIHTCDFTVVQYKGQFLVCYNGYIRWRNRQGLSLSGNSPSAA